MGCDIHGVWQAKRDGKWYDVASTWEQNRHYLLFSWLANVRNGYGFAGIPTYAPVTPIAEPRGLPNDFKLVDEEHPTVVEAIDLRRRKYLDSDALALEPSVWMGDHSHSWLTADEILSAERPALVDRTGIVPIEFYRSWDGETPPESWSGGISGQGVSVANAPEDIRPTTTHVRIHWQQSDELGYFVDEVKRLKDEHGDVRFVFGFDS